MSNFAFLQTEWPLMFESAMRVEATANTDARTSCFYARRTLEMAVAWLFQHDRSLKLPYQPNLNAFIHEPTFRAVLGDTIFTKANVIRSLGNKAVHENQRMYESPFTDISQQGPEAVFPVAKVTELVLVLDDIRERARA